MEEKKKSERKTNLKEKKKNKASMQFERNKPKTKGRKVHMRPQEVHFTLVENKE